MGRKAGKLNVTFILTVFGSVHAAMKNLTTKISKLQSNADPFTSRSHPSMGPEGRAVPIR